MLEGVSEVFKHFQASKLASMALFLASATLVVGPHYHEGVPKVDGVWLPVVWFIMLFTGILCFCWIATGVFGTTGRVTKCLWRSWFPVRWEHLTAEQRHLLSIIVRRGGTIDVTDEQIYVNMADRIITQVSADKMVKCGLLDHTLTGVYYLTDAGNEFVLKHPQLRQP